MARVDHFEIHCDDPEEASRFYGSVFGWIIQKREDQDYWLIHTGRSDAAGVNGGIRKPVTQGQTVVPNITVDNLDAFLSKVTEQGGKLLGEKISIPRTGTIAYCQDTQGNTFSLLQKHIDAS